MIKTLLRNVAEERKTLGAPAKTAEDSIPIVTLGKDGVWTAGGTATGKFALASGKATGKLRSLPVLGRLGRGDSDSRSESKYSKTWRFSDVNFGVSSEDDKESMLMDYSALLNMMTEQTKITVVNRKLDVKEFARRAAIRAKEDDLDGYRREYNKILLDKAKKGNGVTQEKYVTVSAFRKSEADAHGFFRRTGDDLAKGLSRLDSKLTEITTDERLDLIRGFFGGVKRESADFRSGVCPDSLEFLPDRFVFENPDGAKHGRVLFLKKYGSFIRDSMIADLTDLRRNLVLSIDVLPVPTDEAVREMENRVLAVESDITRWQKRQNNANNFSAEVPYTLEQTRGEMREFLDDLVARDQRMMFVLVTLVHVADTPEDLDADTETLEATAKKHFCELDVLRYRQEEGLSTVLPYGLRHIDTLRTLTSEGTAVLMPFDCREVMDAGGVFYGANAASHNLIICNRKNLLNGNGFILGVSGGGKSFAAKCEMTNVALATDDDVIIIDPEREYGPLVRKLGGEVVDISVSGGNFVNPLDLCAEFADGADPVGMKSEFVITLFDRVVGSGKIDARDKSLIDRCVKHIYAGFVKSGFRGEPPTLFHLHRLLKEIGVKENYETAITLADAIDLFVHGSLNIFAHRTNVNMQNRIMLFDIFDLGKQLKGVGMLVMLDAVMNRVAQNRRRGKATWVYIDEIYLFFASEFSASFLAESWKRFRKYGALATGITQNVEDCLRSESARTMLANSEFLLMLSQSATDRAELARLLSISETQERYITNGEPGEGLVKIGGALVPFVNRFPKDTELYRLMTTKPGEGEGR